MQIQENFLGLVPNSIIDTHFIERGRCGRLIIFMYSLFNKNHEDVLGIGIDDRTALCINPGGVATVYGCGSVSFFQVDEKTRIVSNGKNYTVENLKCDQLDEDWQYDLTKKSIHFIPFSAKHVDTNRFLKPVEPDIWLTGNESISQITSTSLPKFLAKYNPANVTIICGPGYGATASQLSVCLGSLNVNNKSILLSSININDTVEEEKIKSANAFIFCGNDLSALSMLRDPGSVLGSAFEKKVGARIPLFAVGNSGKTLCGNYIDNLDKKDDASYRGFMTNNSGNGVFDDLVFQPLWFVNSDFTENRTSALLYGLMRNRKRFGVYMDGADYSEIDSDARSISLNGSMPIFVVDASETDYIDSSKWKVDGAVSARQIVAMTNLRYNVSSAEKTYSFDMRTLTSVTSVKVKRDERKSFRLENNYPNPFNGSTKIVFNLAASSFVSLSVFNILGCEVDRVLDRVLEAGQYSYDFIPKRGVSSGIYFYRLITDGYSQTKKMVYMR